VELWHTALDGTREKWAGPLLTSPRDSVNPHLACCFLMKVELKKGLDKTGESIYLNNQINQNNK
jgi:hypothetical protein